MICCKLIKNIIPNQTYLNLTSVWIHVLKAPNYFDELLPTHRISMSLFWNNSDFDQFFSISFDLGSMNYFFDELVMDDFCLSLIIGTLPFLVAILVNSAP